MPEDDVNAGNFAIRRGSSAAGAAATAARGTSAGGFGETPERPVEEGIRTVPLPRMNVDERGAGSTAGSSLSPAVSAALSSIGIPEKTEKTPVPVVFPEDLEKISSGERYQLSLIVQGSFNDRDWNKAAGELKRFLDLPRSERGAHKARFYLGQCYYFSGKNREALFEFLAAREYFPDETGPWLRAVLTGLPEQSGK
jgi:TolA-binding protein